MSLALKTCALSSTWELCRVIYQVPAFVSLPLLWFWTEMNSLSKTKKKSKVEGKSSSRSLCTHHGYLFPLITMSYSRQWFLLASYALCSLTRRKAKWQTLHQEVTVGTGVHSFQSYYYSCIWKDEREGQC